MSSYVMIGADLIAITVLVFAIFLPRHDRRDLIVAYLGVNIGVLAVTAALATSSVGAGLGLGLFGVLSIIRLRSQELAHHEIAYYFAALALGLIGGLGIAPTWLDLAMMAAVVLSIAIGDHPRVAGSRAEARTVSQDLLLDRALTDEAAVIAYAERLLETRVVTAVIHRIDLVAGTTKVTVRHHPGQRIAAPGNASILREELACAR